MSSKQIPVLQQLKYYLLTKSTFKGEKYVCHWTKSICNGLLIASNKIVLYGTLSDDSL